MRGRVCSGILLAAALFAAPAAGQTPPAAPPTIAIGDWLLSPSLEVRTRGEYRRDPPDLGGLDFFGRRTERIRDAWVVMERTRLGLGADRGALRAQFTIQDARALGSPSPTARLVGSRAFGTIAPYEAFAEAHGSGTRPSYVRLGRQAVVWGEGRLIGDADFAPAGRSLDALRGRLGIGGFDFEVLGAILEAPSTLGAAFSDKTGPTRSGVQLAGVTAKWSIAPLLKLEAFGIARISRSSGEELDGSRFSAARLSGETYTGSLRVSGDGDGWSYGAEGAYQGGTTAYSPTVGGSDVAAWAAYGHVKKTIDALMWSPALRLGASYASGANGKGAYKQFDPLLADPQRFHGQMDLFAWSNLIDASARVEATPSPDTTLGLEYRYARLADKNGEWIGSYLTAVGRATGGDPPGTFGNPPGIGPGVPAAELGHEIDVVIAYRPWLPLELRAGWSGLLLGDGAKAIMASWARGSDDGSGKITPASISQYAYLQATLTVP